MPNTDQRPKVTVEDLLHLKRAERPDAEFWTGFERELRQKQLTALLEKRPWWREFPQLLARRAYLPVGATAILAFTLVSVKYYAPAQLPQVEGPVAGAPVAIDDHHVSTVAARTVVSSPLVNRSDLPISAPADSALVADSAAMPAAEEAIELMPLLARPQENERPSARLLTTNLAHFGQSDADFNAPVIGNRLSSRTHATEAASSVELASIATTPSARNRLLAQYNERQLTPEPMAPAIVREKLARRLGDSELSDRSGRLRGDVDTFSTPMPQIVALRF